ncbi:MAG: hypothetical protein VX278_23430 [Myxococcota bacterium]|nr:hypothetical protein [Myxococcota bacterium]
MRKFRNWFYSVGKPGFDIAIRSDCKECMDMFPIQAVEVSNYWLLYRNVYDEQR